MRGFFLLSTLMCSLTLTIAGCRSGGTILTDVPAATSDIRRAFVSVLGEPKKMSSDGKELMSSYHDRRGFSIEETKDSKSKRERLFTQLSILGDRRPYNIQVETFVESRNDVDEFELSGRDDRLASKLADKILRQLNEGREGRSIIDEFKPY